MIYLPFWVRLLAIAAACLTPLLGTATETAPPLPNGLYAQITTPHGVMTCELYFEKTPMTVASFVGLAEGTLGPAPRRPYFNGIAFHRVVPGFVVQGGDPLGTGEGGPGYEFPDEFAPGLRHDAAGVLSMANGGPDTNGSQFFITLAPVNRLNYLHTVFGRTVRGLEVVSQIKQGDKMSVAIVRVGPAAEAFHVDEASFAKLMAGKPRAIPPPFDDVAGLLQTEPPRAKALSYKLANFTRFTRVKLFGRLFDKFEPESATQTPEQFVETLGRKLIPDSRGVLVVWFAQDGQWFLYSPSRPDLTLPKPTPWPALKSEPAPKPEDVALDHKRQLLAGLNDVLDGLIFQLEPK